MKYTQQVRTHPLMLSSTVEAGKTSFSVTNRPKLVQDRSSLYSGGQKSARMCWERQTRTEPQKDTQDWVDLTRTDFTENVAVESHKEPKMKNSSTQKVVQHKQTSECTITERWNNKLAKLELGGVLLTAGRWRWLTGDEFQACISQDGSEAGNSPVQPGNRKEQKGRREKAPGKTPNRMAWAFVWLFKRF